MRTDWLAEHLGRPAAWSWSSPTRTCCSTRPATSRARSRSTGTPTSTTRRPATTSTARASPSCSAASGIARDTTVVIYGDKNNWWAAYALWVFTLFGHEDVRLLDGGRAKWSAEGRPLHHRACPSRTPVDYPVVERDDARAAPSRRTCSSHFGNAADRRAPPEEYTRRAHHRARVPGGAALRAGHIPTAQNVPWAKAAAEDGTFQSRTELRGHLPRRGRPQAGRRRDRVLPDRRAVEPHLVRAHPPARLRGVRNYDGSWTEWGSAVRVPIVKGEQPGEVPAAFAGR